MVLRVGLPEQTCDLFEDNLLWTVTQIRILKLIDDLPKWLYVPERL